MKPLSLRVFILSFVICLPKLGEPSQDDSKAISLPNRDFSQFIFFSVLEGLYEDGVSSETLNLIIPNKSFSEHFIYGCSMCLPTYNAMILYRSRAPFYSLKVDGRFDPPKQWDTFGNGLGEDVVTQLKSSNKEIRLKAIEALIKKWMDRRIERMRLSPKEYADLVDRLEEARAAADKLVERWKKNNNYGIESTRLHCAICEGAASGR